MLTAAARLHAAKTLAQRSGLSLDHAAQSLGLGVFGSKQQTMAALMAALEAGHTTLPAIEGLMDGSPSMPVPSRAPAAPSTAAVDAAAAVAARAEAGAVAAATRLDAIDGILTGIKLDAGSLTVEVRNLAGEITTLHEQVADIAVEVRRAADLKIEPETVRAAVQAAVESALGPVIAAAQSSPEVAAAVQNAAAALPTRKTAQEVFGLALHDQRGNELSVDVYSDPEAPAIDSHFVWTESLLRPLIAAQESGQPLWLGGEKGTGKTTVAMQWAARTGRAFTRTVFSKYTTVEQYLGATGLIDGSTVFAPGPVLRSITRPGSITLLDEITALDPGEAMPLNGLLERGQGRVNLGGVTWVKAPGAMIIAADNTLGNGDLTGRYAGTRGMNSALLDRFALVVPVSFLPPDVEAEALRRLTGCSAKLADEVVSILSACRAKAQTGDLVDAPSIRQATAWIESMSILGIRAAWDMTIASHQPAESAVTVEAIYSTHVNEARIIKML